MKTKTIKLIATLVMLGVSVSAYAVNAGGYAGIFGGMGSTNVKNSGSGNNSTSNTGLAGGALFGYQNARYSAFELGYIHFANGTSTASPPCGSPVIHNDAIDLLLKGILPLAGTGLDVFAKGGLALVRSKGGGTCSTNETTASVKPAIAVGASYDLSQTTVADLTYTQAFINNKHIQNASLLSLGITYHFVDVYCGQFLC